MTKAINTTDVTKAIREAFALGDAYGIKIAELQKALKGQDVLLVKETVNAAAETHYAAKGAKRVDKVRGEGKTWAMNTASQTAKKAADRVIADILGKAVEQKAEFEVPAEMQALADKLIKMAATYKEANRLVSTALANARAK